MIIYGKNPIREAIYKKRRIYKLFLDQKFSDRKYLDFLNEFNVNYTYLPKDKLNEMTSNAVHQGVVAEVDSYSYYEFEDVFKADKVNRLVILDEITDPHNLGAILRTAEAAGIDAIVVSKRQQAPLNATVAKVSSGAIEHVPVVAASNINNFLLKIKKLGFLVVGTDGNAPYDYHEIPRGQNIAVILGSEGSGIRPLVKSNCDILVKIPMYGKINSLNVSVAGALLMYEMIKE
ncbi:MAG TPA: 23S rRNA (guanosine(2251)-2'-O)-methyltransferase RlmB [Acholeplasmataceae bacterium]|nr:23S rRNA (guanosine(2251)-2'-O)-methyltransferase RlmB [Acholeplasmataceae bacterium]HQC30808.1 23S rRNA (guanosine(2251)-2'-O)-methyltransferase RlmB [Acholeplasmataceae bacterium]